MVSGMPHWTEGGSDAAAGTSVDTREQRLERIFRVSLLNVLLEGHGCAVDDWSLDQYIVRSRTGRSEVVAALPQVWRTVEDISARKVDPLDPALLARLGAQAV